MLLIDDLHAGIGDTEILSGLSLEVAAGEVHAIMGPNRSFKSTLAHVLAGRDPYQVTAGRVLYDGADLLAMMPEERAAAGVFLGFQHPVDIPGVANMYFSCAPPSTPPGPRRSRSRRVPRPRRGEAPPGRDGPDAHGSPGQRRVLRRGEEAQRDPPDAVLRPRLAILDETDSGLDIDALRVVAAGVSSLRSPDTAAILITHHQRLLDHLIPDQVHVLAGGRIVRSGGPELAAELEAHGYAGFDARSGHELPTPIGSGR